MASSLQFETLLKEIIAEEREQTLEDIANGVEDYAAYRELVGYIRALDAYGDWCAEVGKKLEER